MEQKNSVEDHLAIYRGYSICNSVSKIVMVKFHVNFRIGNRRSNRDPSDASNGFHLKSRRFSVDMGPPLFPEEIGDVSCNTIGH